MFIINLSCEILIYKEHSISLFFSHLNTVIYKYFIESSNKARIC